MNKGNKSEEEENEEPKKIQIAWEPSNWGEKDKFFYL